MDIGARSAWARISRSRSARGQALGDLRSGGVQLLLLLRPGLCVPDLQVLTGADHDARAGEAGVLDQRLGDADAARRIELLVEGATVETAARGAPVLAERAVRREEAVGQLLELLGRVRPDAGVEAFRQNNPVGERGPEARGNREAILGVEAVLVETPKCYPVDSFLRPGKELGPE